MLFNLVWNRVVEAQGLRKNIIKSRTQIVAYTDDMVVRKGQVNEVQSVTWKANDQWSNDKSNQEKVYSMVN